MIVLEVSIAFYHADFYFLFFNNINHNFPVVYSCIVSIIRFFFFIFFYKLAY